MTIKLRNYDEVKVKFPKYKEMYDLMVHDLETKEVPKQVDLISNQIMKVGGPRLVFLYGVAGTGKNVFAQFLAAKMGSPLLEMQMDMGTERSDLIGTMVPNPDAAEDGNMYKFLEEALTIAAKYGLMLAIHEGNYAIPQVASLLNSFTDGSRFFKLNGEFVPIHENFVLVITLNPGYRGTFPFNPALVSRGLYVPTETPDGETMLKWLVKSESERTAIEAGVYKEPVMPIEKFPAKAFEVLHTIGRHYYKHANSQTSNVDVTFRHMQRAADMILLDPMSIDHIKQSLTHTLFGSMGVNEDMTEILMNFANTGAMYDLYKQIASEFEAVLKPKKAKPEPKKVEPKEEDEDGDELSRDAVTRILRKSSHVINGGYIRGDIKI